MLTLVSSDRADGAPYGESADEESDPVQAYGCPPHTHRFLRKLAVACLELPETGSHTI